MGEKYKIEAYNSTIELIDLDFLNYGFGISLPTTIFNPDNIYYLPTQDNGYINITTKDANKILLNFMDDIRFTLVSYNYGLFSTWASKYDETTFYNLKRCQPTDIIALVEEPGFIEYQEGYRIAKYYDRYDLDAYRIAMEVDVYPFKGNTDFSYHGYLTMLCYDGIMRSIIYAEPKFDEKNPYQLIYPISQQAYWLDIGVDWENQPTNTKADEEVEDREVIENKGNDYNNDFEYEKWPSYMNEDGTPKENINTENSQGSSISEDIKNEENNNNITEEKDETNSELNNYTSTENQENEQNSSEQTNENKWN